MIAFSTSIKLREDSKICSAFKGSCLKQKNSTYTPSNRVNIFFPYELDT